MSKSISLSSPPMGSRRVSLDSCREQDASASELDAQSINSIENQKTNPELKKGAYHFFSPEIAHLRAAYLKPLVMVIVLIIITQWAFITLYFGSLSHNPTFVPQLRGLLIDRDGSEFGSAMVSAFTENVSGANGVGKHHLGWKIISASQYPTNEAVAQAVVEEKAWVAVVVGTGATAKLAAARQHGDASYNPGSAVTVYYNQARNEQASGNYIVPLTTTLVNQTLTQYSLQSTAKYIAQVGANSTAWALLGQAPQTLVTPVSYTMVNVRPYTTPVAAAMTLVGQIYIIIFGFVITMAGYGLRAQIAPYLTMRSYMAFRLFAPFLAYVVVSFSYTMIDLPFKVPFDAKFSYAGGFFITWLFMLMGMTALGFATEAMITILGPNFMAFFLLPLIISNIAVASVPIDLQPWIYRYGYGFPVYNLGIAIRTIIFNTHSHMGRNAGVLIAWIALSMGTITVFTYLTERRTRAAIASDQEKAAST